MTQKYPSYAGPAITVKHADGIHDGRSHRILAVGHDAVVTVCGEEIPKDKISQHTKRLPMLGRCFKCTGESNVSEFASGNFNPGKDVV